MRSSKNGIVLYRIQALAQPNESNQTKLAEAHPTGEVDISCRLISWCDFLFLRLPPMVRPVSGRKLQCKV